MSQKKSECQIAKFREKASELCCGEDESTFIDRLRQIAKSPPTPAKKDKEKAPE